jgi:hypothetical protein
MTTLTLQPAAAAGIDTYTQQGNPNTNYGSNATIEIRGWEGVRSNGLIKFDLAGIPAGAEIISATLSLFGQGGGSDGTLNIFRILAANPGWTEGGATWNYANSANETRWAGDAASTALTRRWDALILFSTGSDWIAWVTRDAETASGGGGCGGSGSDWTATFEPVDAWVTVVNGCVTDVTWKQDAVSSERTTAMVSGVLLGAAMQQTVYGGT